MFRAHRPLGKTIRQAVSQTFSHAFTAFRLNKPGTHTILISHAPQCQSWAAPAVIDKG